MPNNQGYIYWPTPHYDPDTVYLDGLLVETGLQGISKKPSSGTLFHMKSHANTSILQRLYFGPEAPQRRDGITFSLEFQVFADDLAEKIRSVAVRSSWFYFTPFDRQTDIFDAVSGEAYKLTRPLARSIVSGVTSVTHPDLVYLDDVLDGAAATVSGQTLTANSTGVIRIDYTPIYKVVLLGDIDERVGETNELLMSLTLEEVVAF